MMLDRELQRDKEATVKSKKFHKFHVEYAKLGAMTMKVLAMLTYFLLISVSLKFR